MIGSDVAPIEVAWTVIALIGIVFSFSNFMAAWLDLRYVGHRRITNGRRTVAVFTTVTECGRFIAQWVFVLIGITAMRLPTPRRMHHHNVIMWGLLLVVTIAMVQSAAVFVMRRRLNHHGF